MATRTRTYHSASAPYALPNSESDSQRLDAGHNAFKEYYGGNFIAPLRNPKSILDLGTGTGTWAIEMAQQFPKATVLGVDISPVTKRRMPHNCSFEMINLVNDFPFPPKSFDVIHARLLLVHLPNAKEIIKKATAALKPGGFLLLEEGTTGLFEDGGIKPGLKRFFDLFVAHMTRLGVNPSIGPEMAGILIASGAFSEVREDVIRPPMNPYTKDEKLNRLGQVLKQFLIKGYSGLSSSVAASGITPDVIQGFVRDINDESRRAYGRLNWVWARKAL